MITTHAPILCQTVEAPNRWGSHQIVIFKDKTIHFNGFSKMINMDCWAGWMFFHCQSCDLHIRFPHTISSLAVFDGLITPHQMARVIAHNTVDQIEYWFKAIPCDRDAISRYNKHKGKKFLKRYGRSPYSLG